MFRTVRKTLLTLAVIALLTPVAKVAFAQNTYNISRFDTHPVITDTHCGGTAENPDCNIAFANGGGFGSRLPTVGAPTFDNMVRLNVGTGSDRCANIYVYDDNEQLIECCSCFISSNGFLQLKTEDDLTSNPFDSLSHTRGLIKVVSSDGASCSNIGSASSLTAANSYTPVPNVREWIQHVPVEPSITPGATGPFQNIVEQQFLAVPSASAAELSNLQTTCNTVIRNGSGFGHCSCGGGTNNFEAGE
jgi:hypothetical protein